MQSERKAPPCDMVCVGIMALVLATAVYLIGFLPHKPTLVPAWIMLGIAVVLLLAVVILLFSNKDTINFHMFGKVFKWMLLAYVVISGMLGSIVFVNRMPADIVATAVVAMVLFAIDIPLLVAFTVAKYQV